MADVKSFSELIEGDEEFRSRWEELDGKSREYLKEVYEGRQVPNLLSDRIFKGVFDPEIYSDSISRLVSSVLKHQVRFLHVLDKEGIILSKYSKGILLDMVVEFEDGTIAIVEIQRKGVDMPPQRCAAYSADVLTKQFTVEKVEKKSDIDYEMLSPVYTIILVEDSMDVFKETGKYHHHFRQMSDTGIESSEEFEFLQYYDYLCLDIFAETKPHVASELENWLNFLTIRMTDEMERFIEKHPEFSEIYERTRAMMKTREDLLNEAAHMMYTEDIVESLKKTYATRARKLERKVEELQLENSQKDEMLLKIRDENSQKDEMLAQQENRIAELEKKLENNVN